MDLWLEEWYRQPTGQGLFLQSFCIPTIHGGQMSEGTTPGKEEVELRQEQQPRATQEQLPRGTDYGADGRKTENTVSRFLHFSIT